MDSATRKAVAASLFAAADKLEAQATMMDVVDAIHSGDPRAVTASSLGRVWQHIQDLSKQSFVIVSAFRAFKPDGSPMSLEDNLARNRQLQEMIRSKGFGYIRLISHWLECQDKSVEYKNCPRDQLVDVTELSMFVPNMSRDEGQRLSKAFDQDGYIYGGPDTGGVIKVLSSSGGEIANLGSRLTTTAIGQGFSSLHDDETRRFAFIGIGVDKPMDAMIASSYEKEKYGVKKFHSIWGQR